MPICTEDEYVKLCLDYEKYITTKEYAAERLVSERMSAGQKKAWKNPETKARRIAAMTIVMNRPEVIAKQRAAHIGKYHTPETIAKMIASQKIAQNKPSTIAKRSGPNCCHWRGGISNLPYAWEFNDELREEIRSRDNHACQLCDALQADYEKKLPVHHIDYDKENSNPANLITLCEICHGKTNTNRKHWTKYFQDLQGIMSINQQVRSIHI